MTKPKSDSADQSARSATLAKSAKSPKAAKSPKSAQSAKSAQSTEAPQPVQSTPAPKIAATPKAAKSKTTKPKVLASPSPAAKAKSQKKPAVAAAVRAKTGAALSEEEPVFKVTLHNGEEDAGLTPFLRKQKMRLLNLRDSLLDSMSEVARDNLRSRAEGSEASAFGQHQADAGSDAYDRDFALSLLSQEQDALYEIDEALKRLEQGSYGVCEMSGKSIPHPRLEAMPFARFTVECQAQIEKQNRGSRMRQSVTSLFGMSDETRESDDEDTAFDGKE